MLLVYNNYSVYAACNIQETLFAHDVGLLQTVNAECDPVCTCVESCSDWNNLSFLFTRYMCLRLEPYSAYYDSSWRVVL